MRVRLYRQQLRIRRQHVRIANHVIRFTRRNVDALRAETENGRRALRRAVGILTDGGLRDVREVKNLGGFHYFCTGLVVSHGNPICVSVGDEVTISGMTVKMGDLLHGDANGVVHIPDACAADVAEAAHKTWERESGQLRRINSPDFTVLPGREIQH